MSKTLLLIVGSPKLKISNSYSIAEYLKNELIQQGWLVEIHFSHQAFKNETKMNEIIEKTKQVDLIGIIFPLYVDGIPGPLIQTLEMLTQHKTKRTTQKIFSIVNSGFPEPHQSQLAVDMIEQFTQEYQAHFIGGLTIGGGGIIGGMPIEQIKHRSKRLIKALNLTIQSLNQTQTVSREAKQLLSKPVFSKLLYNTFANKGWKMQAKKYGSPNLYRTPDK